MSEHKEEVRGMFENILNAPFKTIEDNDNAAMIENGNCPYSKCDGSGYYTQEDGLSRVAIKCECYDDEVLRRKLKNSNMNPACWNQEWMDNGTTGVLLHPIKNPPERQLKMGKNKKPLAVQEPEGEEENLQRCYQQIQLKHSLKRVVDEYLKIALNFLEEGNAEVKNLMFLGDTGRGKTFMMNYLGREFLKKNKKVYFTTMRTMVKDVMNPDKDIEKIVEEVDLLLIDELGYEYHTDTGYAVTQIKEMLRVRYNKKLPVICTTNLYPAGIEAMYDKSLMSLFKGTYLMMYIDNPDGDYRMEEANNDLNKFASVFEI